jgi:hypothetical protein
LMAGDSYSIVGECIGDLALIENRQESIGRNHVSEMPVLRPLAGGPIRIGQ